MVEREFPHAGVLRDAVWRRERRLDVPAVVLALDQEVAVLDQPLLEALRRDREVHADAGAAEDVLHAVLLGRTIAAPQHDRGELSRGAVPRLDPARARAARQRDERGEPIAARLRELRVEQRTGADADARDTARVDRIL